MFLKISQNSQKNHLRQRLFSDKVAGRGDCFWCFSCLLLKISCLFHFNRKIKWKREIPWWSSNIYFFCMSIDLFDVKDFKLKVDYSKNIWKEENRRHGLVCLLVSYISKKKNLLKTAILLVQELRKQENSWFFGPTLTLILPIFVERKKGKLHMMEKVGLVYIRRYYKNMYMIALPYFERVLQTLRYEDD